MTSETERALRQAARKLAEWNAERDRLVRQAIAEGGSLRVVADAAASRRSWRGHRHEHVNDRTGRGA